MLQKTSHFMREANLIGGDWVQADSGATIDVTNPATGLKIGTVPKSGKAETRRAIEAAEEAFQSWKKTSVLDRHKLLRKLHDAIMDNQQPLAELLTTEQGKSLAEAKGEIAHLRRLHPVVRRGRPPHLWRRGAVALGGPPHHRHQAAGRRHRGDHAVEFPVVDAGAQARPGARGRLHDRGQAGLADALFGAGLGRAGRGGRFPEGRDQHRHRLGRRDRRRDLRQPAGQEAHLHRLDRDRQDADPEVRRDGQEGVDGARRQRAVHRLRRRRRRSRGRGRDRRQVPQLRPDLRLHQPLLRAGGHLRSVRRETRRRQHQAQGRLRASKRARSRVR